jgi:chitodextrinase
LNVHTTSVLDNAVTIAWDASTDPFGVSGYKIYRNDSLVGTSETTSFSDTGLLPSTQYSYTVEAYNVANLVSTPSLALNVTTAFDTTPPSVPTGLHSTGQTDLSISLSWNASTDNVAVSGYDVFRNGTLVTSTIGTSFTDSGLSVDTAYVYTVLAYDTSGNDSAQSTPLDVSTLIDTTPPTIPQQLASPSQTISTINLTWDAATDPVGVTGYDVYRNGTFLRAVSGTTYADTGLHYNTNYNYTVAAFDQYNNKSSPSQALSVSTLPDTVPPSVSLTSPGNGASIKLNVPLAATASDAFGVTKVEFFVDSTLITTLTSPPYTFSWNSYAVHNGAHTLTAEAFDTPGNTATQSAAVTVDNPPPPLVGDFNDDHIVNILDLSYLLSNWGRSNSVISQSLNHSGNVGIIDLSIFLSHYGENDSDYN